MKTLLIAVLALALISCDNDKTKKPDPEDMGVPVLNGMWETGCLSNSTPYTGPLGEKRLITISGSSIKTEYFLYDDANCSSVQHQLTIEKNSTVGFTDLSSKDQKTGMYNIDDSVDSFKLIAANPDYADVLSDSDYCNIKEWKAGHPYTVTGVRCAGKILFPRVTKYTILKFDDKPDPDVFVLGKFTNSENGSTPQNRPKALGGDVHIKITQ